MAKKKSKEYTGLMLEATGKKVRIFCRDIEFKEKGKKKTATVYSTSISKKGADDEYINMNLSVHFKRDEQPEKEWIQTGGRGKKKYSYFDISIFEGWYTFRVSDGTYYPGIFVNDYEVLDVEDEDDEDDDEDDEDDIPF